MVSTGWIRMVSTEYIKMVSTGWVTMVSTGWVTMVSTGWISCNQWVRTGCRVRYGSDQSPHTPYRLNDSLCIPMVSWAYSAARLRRASGVSNSRSLVFMPCNTLSSMGRPWQSQPGTNRTYHRRHVSEVVLIDRRAMVVLARYQQDSDRECGGVRIKLLRQYAPFFPSRSDTC